MGKNRLSSHAFNSTERVYSDKIKAIRSGNCPRVLDLFSGCGGLSLGFQSAGFQITSAVEIDAAAIKTHALNFHKASDTKTANPYDNPVDITAVEPEELFTLYGLDGPVDSLVDVIIGGPPCQAFARVGRAKLREVAEHPEAFLRDKRSNLYLRYLDYVKALKPVALLMENVPDILNFGGHNIAEEICEVLEDLGYSSHYTLLNAVYYGVPEMRERMFLIAYVRELDISEWFPAPTHFMKLPPGYNGTRQVALQTIKNDLFEKGQYFLAPANPDPLSTKPAITASDALSDLPKITDDSYLKTGKGPRHFTNFTAYRSSPQNDYQYLMRNWHGYESDQGVYDHVIRYLPRDYKIFARMQPGDQYPEAYKLAELMFQEHLALIKKQKGKSIREGSPDYIKARNSFIPPYDSTKFPNKWRKMESDLPARTLMAHLGKDSYSHIHYDSSQARTISVREAARLQSFPDGFKFVGPMNPAFKQIGNAVPPLLAKAIAEVMLNQIRK